MKISADKISYMETKIKEGLDGLDIEALEGTYKRGDLTPRRFRWDCLWTAKLSQWISDNVYKDGGNDEHIDTALRKIMTNMKLEWAATK